ncbi:MAG: hypothetical protein JSW51_07400 [Gemmatimonadota bacterium]|nr:MAG: hypothetical protein JSW51_07400 [Gemmatimonadota bacterium]
MKLVTTLAAAVVAVLAASTSLAAQDSHYWTMQYGPRPSLLGGAVIGSVDDVSASYYNPGALGLAQDLAFAVSTNVFEYSLVRLEDGGGEGVDLGTSKSGIRPSLVAGSITRDLFGGGTVAYSVLTRMRGSQDLAGYAILTADEIDPDLGLEDAAGLVSFEGEFNEIWAGLSYARPLGSHLSLGMSWYGAFRSQDRARETISEAVDTARVGSASLDMAAGKYYSVRTLLKVGAFGQFGAVTVGATVTTPSLHITGSGELGLNRGVFRPDTTALAATIQTDLAAEFKSPLSVGFGGAVRLGNTRLHASAEWFDAIAPYVVIQGEEFVTQEPEVIWTPAPMQQLDEVFNWGAGLEHAFSTRFSVYASYYTDKSGLTDKLTDPTPSLSILPIDINTVTAGSDFVIGSARFTLGVGYGWGKKLDRNLTDALKGEDEEFEATFVYRNIRLIFGFEIGI